MSLLFNGTYANPTQPLWASYGSGGSTGPTGPTGPSGGGGGSTGPTGPTGASGSASLPDGVEMVVYYVDQITAQTSGALSLINQYGTVYTSRTAYITFDAPSSSFTVQKAGSFRINFGGWKCGPGDGVLRVVVTRSASPVYDRRTEICNNDCGLFYANFYWNDFQVGDVIQLYKDENNTGTQITTTIDSNNDQCGHAIFFYSGPNY